LRRPTKRQAEHALAMTHIRDVVYRTLRDFQDGKFREGSGVSAGQLGVAMTTAYDRIIKAVDATFIERGATR